jgi:putative flavoprotein involved in K+ transport
VGVNDGKAQFSGSLANHCAMADLKLGRLLDRIDTWAEQSGKGSEVAAPERLAPTRVEETPCLSLDLSSDRIGTLIWATGFRPDYRWLHLPVLDRKGRLRHDGGIVDAPGLYALGLNFMRRRKSSFIHGAEDDVRDLGAHLATFLRDCGIHIARRAVG